MNVRDSDGWTQFCHKMFVFEFDSIFFCQKPFTLWFKPTLYFPKNAHILHPKSLPNNTHMGILRWLIFYRLGWVQFYRYQKFKLAVIKSAFLTEIGLLA